MFRNEEYNCMIYNDLSFFLFFFCFVLTNSADADVGTELPVWVPQSDLQVSPPKCTWTPEPNPAGPLWLHEEKPCFSQRGVCEMPRSSVDLFQTFQGVMRLVHMQIKRRVFLHMQHKLSAGSSWCCYYGNRCRSNAACEQQSQADYLRLKAFLHIPNWL